MEDKSTVNINLKTQLVFVAHKLNSGQNDNEIDITHTKTEESQGDKHMEDGEEGS